MLKHRLPYGGCKHDLIGSVHFTQSQYLAPSLSLQLASCGLKMSMNASELPAHRRPGAPAGWATGNRKPSGHAARPWANAGGPMAMCLGSRGPRAGAHGRAIASTPWLHKLVDKGYKKKLLMKFYHRFCSKFGRHKKLFDFTRPTQLLVPIKSWLNSI